MAVLPLTQMYVVGPLTVIYLYPIIFGLVTRRQVKRNPIDYPDSDIVKQVTKKKNYCKKLVHITPLIFTSIGIYMGFVIIHIYSAVRFIQYGDEVLSSYHGKSHPLPITHAVVSLTVIGGGFVLLVTVLAVRISKSKKHDAQLITFTKQSNTAEEKILFL